MPCHGQGGVPSRHHQGSRSLRKSSQRSGRFALSHPCRLCHAGDSRVSNLKMRSASEKINTPNLTADCLHDVRMLIVAMPATLSEHTVTRIQHFERPGALGSTVRRLWTLQNAFKGSRTIRDASRRALRLVFWSCRTLGLHDQDILECPRTLQDALEGFKNVLTWFWTF